MAKQDAEVTNVACHCLIAGIILLHYIKIIFSTPVVFLKTNFLLLKRCLISAPGLLSRPK
jgi:hypothetical protein